LSESTALNAFRTLHPALQEALYRMRWTHLRPIQVTAINTVFGHPGDIILEAHTASGKTEAAFLPILSQVVEPSTDGVQVVYVGPLKALINDQFLRLERLCEQAEIPVHKWHGDVGQAAKHRLVRSPSGILLITPESIESLFINHSRHLSRMFRALRFVVIDEMHSFLGTERGAHLRSLVSRLLEKSREDPRKIGLSATLGDSEAGRRWLQPMGGRGFHLIRDTTGKTVHLCIIGYENPRPAPRQPPQPADDLEDRPLERDVFDAFHGQTALIFANSKSVIESCTDFAKREAERRHVRDLFRIHHGSLSRQEREETEDALRSNLPTATFCTSTLEMGIDVGNVKSVGQLGAPWSVSSLTQRLGRSGRKEDEPSVIRIFIEEDEPEADSSVLDRLFPDLLQATAMVQLMLAKWCEPPDVDRLHLSTLVQQVLSVIAERGGSQPDQIFDKLVLRGGFPNVDEESFTELLRCLGRADLIEQTVEGLLILGLKGEQIVRHHDFYVAFNVNEEYRVTFEGGHIGNIVPPSSLIEADMSASASRNQDDLRIILAGRRWKILAIDQDAREIRVQPSPGGRVVYWPPIEPDVHPRVRHTMRSILTEDGEIAYLDSKAQKMLAISRRTARDARLLDCALMQDGPDVLWWTWTGTRIQRTLYGLGAFVAGLSVEDHGLLLSFKKTTAKELRSLYSEFAKSSIEPDLLAARFVDLCREKYERFLSPALLARSFARARLDVKGAMDVIAEM
jgi:ATP-dependent Lhr-like helicase